MYTKRHLIFYFFLFLLLAGQGFALVKTVIIFKNSGKEKETKIELWCDDHYFGSREENRQQLKTFIETALLKGGPVHLAVESKFFNDVDIRTTNSSSFFKTLSEKLGWSYTDIFSLDQSPQDASAPTWIAWDLPLILMKIFNQEELPSFIALDEEQKKYIISNVFVDFVDPRLRISSNTVKPDQPDELENELMEKFEKANQSSPIKIAPMLSQYAQERLKNEQSNSSASSSDQTPQHAHIFDIALISSIITKIYDDGNDAPKRLIVLCGHWHAGHLDKLLPSLGFSHRIKYQLPNSKNTVTSVAEKLSSTARRKLNFAATDN